MDKYYGERYLHPDHHISVSDGTSGRRAVYGPVGIMGPFDTTEELVKTIADEDDGDIYYWRYTKGRLGEVIGDTLTGIKTIKPAQMG